MENTQNEQNKKEKKSITFIFGPESTISMEKHGSGSKVLWACYSSAGENKLASIKDGRQMGLKTRQSWKKIH